MTLAAIGMIVSGILNLLMLPPKPKNLSWFKNFSIFFQWLLLPLTMIVFGSLPLLRPR
jgi:uncharacterized membrane protein YgaE (UPF0421/DUF939 family)